MELKEAWDGINGEVTEETTADLKYIGQKTCQGQRPPQQTHNGRAGFLKPPLKQKRKQRTTGEPAELRGAVRVWTPK